MEVMNRSLFFSTWYGFSFDDPDHLTAVLLRFAEIAPEHHHALRPKGYCW
jgi:hypothetical protein